MNKKIPLFKNQHTDKLNNPLYAKDKKCISNSFTNMSSEIIDNFIINNSITDESSSK